MAGRAAKNKESKDVVSFLRSVRTELGFLVSKVIPSLGLRYRKRKGKRFVRVETFVEGAEGIWDEVKLIFRRAYAETRSLPSKLLKKAGLAGSQLSHKFGWFRELKLQFRRSWARVKSNVWKRSPLFRKLTEALLGLANSFLGSLASLVPLVHPIKELKEYLESGLRVVW